MFFFLKDNEKIIDSITVNIVALACTNCTTTETILNNEWSNDNHGLSAETQDYKSNGNPVEINPIDEGFIILSDNEKKQPLAAISSTSAGPTKKKQTSTSRTLPNVTSSPTTTTCKTKHQTTPTSTSKMTTTTLTKTPNHTTDSTVDPSRSRRGRRLLNDPSYDTDIDTSSTSTSLDDNNDVDSFLKVNDEDLSKQLVNMEFTVDGSGFSMYQLNNYLFQ
jgi:hypothetical protein